MTLFSKNLKYYRLKKSLTKKELAALCGVSPMAITHYENEGRFPGMEIMKRLADALHVRVTDFLVSRNQNLSFCHNEFRKGSALGSEKQELVRESAEEYFSRYMTVVEILGGDVLPPAPLCHAIDVSGDAEIDASALRRHLNFSPEGPLEELTAQLENKGFLIYEMDLDDRRFSGMNGTVNGRPYMTVNSRMSPERKRSTLVHELAHLMFRWDSVKMTEKAIENHATAIAGAFLLPCKDLQLELGPRRTLLSYDMVNVAKEYGVSVQLLLKRANVCGILNDASYRNNCVLISRLGWRSNEPSQVTEEAPMMFSQFVYRAIAEKDISVQKGAELLQVPYETVAQNCWVHED